MLPSSLTSFLVPLLGLQVPRPSTPAPQPETVPLHFELRQLHALTSDAHVVFSDVSQSHLADLALNGDTNSYTISHTVPLTTYKPPSFDAFTHARRSSWDSSVQSAALNWNEDVVVGPDVESRETLLLLAKMTNNAYLVPGETGWYELGDEWPVSYPFGWQPPYTDGFRGHVFATPDNSTVVVSIKGTSAGVWNAGETAKKDKLNDNLLFSCCCARVNWSWTTVCGCYRGSYKCDENCVEKALTDDSLYYPVATNLYNNLTYMYPDSNIWVIGHSLGGALASLVGVTFGAPVVTFEAPGDKMASRRLHLPSPPSLHHVAHVFHTADPIAMGTCNGILSYCSLGGYAMESRCHLGKTIVYDTVSNLSWSVNIRTHGIVTVIEKVLGVPWRPSVVMGREVPEPVPQDDCVVRQWSTKGMVSSIADITGPQDCYSWDFGTYTTKGKR
ncbi:Putative lipase ATG15 [Leucoagaricus sp. SymC.cos]|nr:Putative lipase ATG15 [Leucoagaricus sp. SymC.cos]